MVGFLLGLHAPVNGVDKFGDTPLHAAAANGHMRTIRLLLEKGANVNAARSRPGSRWGAHVMASRGGHADVVAFFNFLTAGGGTF